MGYSEIDNLAWDDFQCAGFTAADMFVGFICESNTTEGKLKIDLSAFGCSSKNFIIQTTR